MLKAGVQLKLTSAAKRHLKAEAIHWHFSFIIVKQRHFFYPSHSEPVPSPSRFSKIEAPPLTRKHQSAVCSAAPRGSSAVILTATCLVLPQRDKIPDVRVRLKCRRGCRSIRREHFNLIDQVLERGAVL